MNQLLMSLILMFCLIMMWSYMFFEFKNFKSSSTKSMKMKITKMSLFMSFDPKSSMNFFFIEEMNWMIMILSTIFLSMSIFSMPSRITVMMKLIFHEMKMQLSIALKSLKDSTCLMFISIFFFIFFLNFIGLVPNSFTVTSHIVFNMFISLPMWMGFFLYGWAKYTNKMFSHLVPNGTPLPLISFMVLIELISAAIRPFTLSIRLMANMVSGHLLMTLMGNSMNLKSPVMVIMLSLVQSVLCSLEIGVSLIQAYVFCILLTLYSDDSDYSK